MAYARIEPFGATRDNWHMAVLASLIYSANRGEGAAELSPQDFMWPEPIDPAPQAELDRAEAQAFWESALGYFKSI